MIKTVGSAGFNPNLGLVFGVNATTAIPADALTYTATVNNTGSTMTLAGVIRAGNNGNIAATVADYYDEVEYYTSANKTWNPLAGKEANELGALGEDWLGKATGGLGSTGERIPTPDGIRIPDRILRLPGLRIFLESKNAAAIDARSIAQITDMTAEGPVILLTRGSLSQLPRALGPLARNGLLKWIRCFPA